MFDGIEAGNNSDDLPVELLLSSNAEPPFIEIQRSVLYLVLINGEMFHRGKVVSSTRSIHRRSQPALLAGVIDAMVRYFISPNRLICQDCD